MDFKYLIHCNGDESSLFAIILHLSIRCFIFVSI